MASAGVREPLRFRGILLSSLNSVLGELNGGVSERPGYRLSSCTLRVPAVKRLVPPFSARSHTADLLLLIRQCASARACVVLPAAM